VAIVKENLWNEVDHPSLYVVTTNAFIKKNGDLVMGAGAAQQAVNGLPTIARECAKVITHGETYGFRIVRRPTDTHRGFGIFQVKRFWMEDADTKLIEISAGSLIAYAINHSGVSIRMNYPGIGNGKLSKEEVAPLIDELANYVTICYY